MINYATSSLIVQLLFSLISGAVKTQSFYHAQVISSGLIGRMLSKNRTIIAFLVVIIIVLTIGAMYVVVIRNSNNLELNLVSVSSSDSGETARYEINNKGSGAWTCDPSKFMIEFSDGSSHPGIPEVPGKIVIEGGGSASGLLFSSYHPSDVTIVGLIYDDGAVQLRTT